MISIAISLWQRILGGGDVPPTPPEGNFLLLETGDYLLLETGDKFLLEEQDDE